MNVKKIVVAAVLGIAAATGGAATQESAGTHMDVSCDRAVHEDFNAAVALLHNMTYAQAREGFVSVAERDPSCAMAYWGVAMTLFQPLWPTRPGPSERQQGWDMVRKAQAGLPADQRERMFIAAAEAFFTDPADNDYWARIRRWEVAARRAHDAFPRDVEAAAWHALALLAVAQVNDSAAVYHTRAAQILKFVLRDRPQHPGGMHYLIHANDLTAREHESLDVTNRYARVAPDNPHALHMPTHIYVRLGDWPQVIEGNSNAARAALRFPAGPNGEFVWDEFPHAIEYLVYALLQRGDDEAALAQLTRLRETARLEPTFKTAFHLASIPARYALERRDWRAAATLPLREPAFLPWDRFPWPECVTVFARGYGAVKLGDTASARGALGRLEELQAIAQRTGEPLFERNVQVLRLVLSAWLAHAGGNDGVARQLMRDAVALEERTPKHAVTPAPTIPAREFLADLLVDQGRLSEALQEYERTLADYPMRLNALLGAAFAATRAGDPARGRLYLDRARRSAIAGARRVPL
jgi:tetratricopeptide (TPR) repeat protein